MSSSTSCTSATSSHTSLVSNGHLPQATSACSTVSSGPHANCSDRNDQQLPPPRFGAGTTVWAWPRHKWASTCG